MQFIIATYSRENLTSDQSFTEQWRPITVSLSSWSAREQDIAADQLYTHHDQAITYDEQNISLVRLSTATVKTSGCSAKSVYSLVIVLISLFVNAHYNDVQFRQISQIFQHVCRIRTFKQVFECTDNRIFALFATFFTYLLFHVYTTCGLLSSYTIILFKYRLYATESRAKVTIEDTRIVKQNTLRRYLKYV